MSQPVTLPSSLAVLIPVIQDLACRGDLPATSGNFSVRDQKNPSQFWMSASGIPKAALTPDDFILCGGDPTTTQVLQPAHNGHAKPSDETPLHHHIYTYQPWAQCVLHSHHHHAALLSRQVWLQANRPTFTPLTFTGWELQKALRGCTTHESIITVPVLTNHQDMVWLAQHTKEVIAPSTVALLLAGHGLYVWGDTVSQAQRHHEALTCLFKLLWDDEQRLATARSKNMTDQISNKTTPDQQITTLRQYCPTTYRLLGEWTDRAAIVAMLQARGLRLQAWQASQPLAINATEDEILAAYQHQCGPYMAQHGYQSADVITVHPQTPNMQALSDKFLKEHTHSEPEVRFFVAGAGDFWFHLSHGRYDREIDCDREIQGTAISTKPMADLLADLPMQEVLCLTCVAGDLLDVPAGVRHWFDMGVGRGPAWPFVKTIRIFTDASGWAPNYTGSPIARQFTG